MDPQSVRRAVEHTYATAASPTGATALAGYTHSQLASVPDGVTEGFFGCGNPLAYTQVRPGDTIVDLGSGAGLDLILAGQAVGRAGRVIGVDMTDAMIERARNNVTRAGLPNVEIRRGLIEQLPVDDASADWVISNCVISLSPEKQRVFGEVARVLRPGGQMLISDIVVDDRLAWLLRRLTNIAPGVAFARTEAAYLEMMAAAGLAAASVVDRKVYDAGELTGLFGDELLRDAASLCPIASLVERVQHGRLARRAISGAARAAAGHVWSAKFRAHRRST